MRELTKSLFSCSLALSLFTLKQAQNLLTPAGSGEDAHPARKAFDAVTHSTTDQFGETLGSAFKMLDNLQRGLTGLAFSLMTGRGGGSHSTNDRTEEEDRTREESSEPLLAADIYRSEVQEGIRSGDARVEHTTTANSHDAGQLR